MDVRRMYGLIAFTLFIVVLASCEDETFNKDIKEGFILIDGFSTRSYEGPETGDPEDDEVNTLRVLAFDKITNECKTNYLYYGSAVTDIIRHPVKQGEYNFFFIANEPSDLNTKDELNAITIGTNFSEFQKIAFPEKAFTSKSAIPMISGIENVNILSGGKFTVNGGSEQTVLTINLRRLAARIDVILNSKVDLGDGTEPDKDIFRSVTFSNLPDRVPLVWGLPSNPPVSVPPATDTWQPIDPDLAYTGDPIQSINRTYSVIDDPDYFGPTIIHPTPINGMVWSKTIKRVIVPSNFFSDKDNDNKAVEFTVNLVDKYNPSCKLKIISEPDPVYTLPANSKLLLTGNIKEPLEMNIEASDWDPAGGNWIISGNRILNVSQIYAEITDLNGIRISFSSNMPKVRVLPTVKKIVGSNIEEMDTNLAFNDLAIEDGGNSTTRFSYDPATGSGYMDILVDGGNATTTITDGSGTYLLTLSAEDESGGNPLQREIKIVVEQNGIRFIYDPWRTTFSGAFFRYNQRGERIISGQSFRTRKWIVTVPDEFKNWIVLSSTPSLDPAVGRDNPGDAEKYPVIPNSFKPFEQNRDSVEGKGRIYFRIGLKTSLPTKETMPKYGYVTIKYYPGIDYTRTKKIFVRQGEEADYLYNEEDIVPASNAVDAAYQNPIKDFQPLIGELRTAAAQFSPYNLTAKEYVDNPMSTLPYKQIPINEGSFVEYPSQGGAYFQWAAKIDSVGNSHLRRAAYNPNSSISIPEESWPRGTVAIMWNPPSSSSIPNYSEEFESCPPGYRRPTDGYVSQRSFNGYYDRLPADTIPAPQNYAEEIRYSEMRVSLFQSPYAGSGNEISNYPTINWSNEDSRGSGTYPTGANFVRKELPGTYDAFYADGFFDRRPIVTAVNATSYCVSPATTTVAYRGVLFFNERTNASLFIPSAGRLNNTSPVRQAYGSTGYYWTASAGPPYTDQGLGFTRYGTKQNRDGAWDFEIAYYWVFPKVNYTDFGNSIRCVKATAYPEDKP